MKLSPVSFHHGYRTEFPLMGYRIKRIAVRETIALSKRKVGGRKGVRFSDRFIEFLYLYKEHVLAD